MKCERCEPGVGHLVDNGIVRDVLQRGGDNALVKLQRDLLNKEMIQQSLLGGRLGGRVGLQVVFHNVSLVSCLSSGIYVYGMAAHVFLSVLPSVGPLENEVFRVSNSQLCIAFGDRIFLHLSSTYLLSTYGANIGLLPPVRSPIALINLLTLLKPCISLLSELQDVQ